MSGVYPCYKNQFKIGTEKSETATLSIADIEEFSVAFDNGVEEWSPYDTQGWKRRFMTGKGITISCKGKRNVGDAGNDEVAGLALKSGEEVERPFAWTFPDGTEVLFKNAIINVSANGTGASTGVGPLEFDVMSNGKPEITYAE